MTLLMLNDVNYDIQSQNGKVSYNHFKNRTRFVWSSPTKAAVSVTSFVSEPCHGVFILAGPAYAAGKKKGLESWMKRFDGAAVLERQMSRFIFRKGKN